MIGKMTVAEEYVWNEWNRSIEYGLFPSLSQSELDFAGAYELYLSNGIEGVPDSKNPRPRLKKLKERQHD